MPIFPVLFTSVHQGGLKRVSIFTLSVIRVGNILIVVILFQNTMKQPGFSYQTTLHYGVLILIKILSYSPFNFYSKNSIFVESCQNSSAFQANSSNFLAPSLHVKPQQTELPQYPRPHGGFEVAHEAGGSGDAKVVTEDHKCAFIAVNEFEVHV